MVGFMWADLHTRMVYTHVCVYSTCVQSPGGPEMSYSIPLVLKSVSLIKPAARLVVGKPPVIFPSPNPNPVQPRLAFYLGSVGVTSGPSVCAASTPTHWSISLVQVGVLCSTDEEKD